jgi:hypothetical protein
VKIFCHEKFCSRPTAELRWVEDAMETSEALQIDLGQGVSTWSAEGCVEVAIS